MLLLSTSTEVAGRPVIKLLGQTGRVGRARKTRRALSVKTGHHICWNGADIVAAFGFLRHSFWDLASSSGEVVSERPVKAYVWRPAP